MATHLPVVYNAALAPSGPDSFPLVMFSPGAAANRNTYSCICMELASRGCMVVAVEHADGSSVGTGVGRGRARGVRWGRARGGRRGRASGELVGRARREGCLAVGGAACGWERSGWGFRWARALC